MGRNLMPQRCAVAFVYLQWVVYLGVLGLLAFRGPGPRTVGWLLAAPLAIYAYVRVFPRISRAMGYGSVDDTLPPDVPESRELEGMAAAPVGSTRVTLYTGLGCPFCPIVEKRLRQLQASMGFELDVVDITARPDLAARNRVAAVPLVQVGERRHAGCMTTSELAAFVQPAPAPEAAPA